jgi:hypothetical protein
VKTCKTCKVEKPFEEFYKHSTTRDGRGCYCKRCSNLRSTQSRQANPEKSRGYCRKHYAKNLDKCRAKGRAHYHANSDKSRDYQLRRDYGITLAGYQALFDAQSGLCAICQKPEKFKRSLSVDPDHGTGEVRGLLCGDCNTSLGKFGDSIQVLRNAVAYLEKQ